ncbi:thioredoxin-like protein [Yamadazyma tenuis ATCC 10573]|nr:thioredoxin-like protein [Yamadazyma tenuis ATCC 10573]EGV65564.1 thioredoxin-like protein [Yamadazyma tenuis ATCC 10573]
MVRSSLPSVQVPETVEEFLALVEQQTKPFAIQLSGEDDEESSDAYSKVADALRKDLTFVSVKGKEFIEALVSKFVDFDASSFAEKAGYVVVHPAEASIIPFSGEEINKDSLTAFFKTEVVPYFSDINRDTYMLYMEAPLPLAYYFYKTPEQREEVEEFFTKLGKTYRGKINFAGLDASLFGKHAESLNMDPEIIPLFAIQDSANNKKYGVDQASNPDGPSIEQIKELIEDFLEGKASPIIKSEPLPTEEEQAASPVYQLVAHNYEELLKDTSKDIFVKYYAHWCGHCKKLAPTWDELGDLYKSGNPDVIIAKIDHSKNDVETSIPIEGYPTLFLYPANGEIDEATGLRKPVVFSGPRVLDAFIDFVKVEGGHGIDGHTLKKVEEEEEEEQEEESIDHDEL